MQPAFISEVNTAAVHRYWIPLAKDSILHCKNGCIKMRPRPGTARGTYPSPRRETPLTRAHVDSCVEFKLQAPYAIEAMLYIDGRSTQVDSAERRRRDDERPPRQDGLFVC